MQLAMAASTSIAAMHARITYLISQSAAPSGMDGWMDGWMDTRAPLQSCSLTPSNREINATWPA